MKATIAYHPTSSVCEDVLTEETRHIILKGDIAIESVLSSQVTKDDITVYTNSKPYRIDKQGDILFLVTKEYATEHPSPLVFCKSFKVFGIPTTIYCDGMFYREKEESVTVN